jgi:hypothetical protein
MKDRTACRSAAAAREQLVAEAHGGQLDEQVVLGVPSSRYWPRGVLAPQLGRHDFEFAEHILGLGGAHRRGD